MQRKIDKNLNKTFAYLIWNSFPLRSYDEITFIMSNNFLALKSENVKHTCLLFQKDESRRSWLSKDQLNTEETSLASAKSSQLLEERAEARQTSSAKNVFF